MQPSHPPENWSPCFSEPPEQSLPTPNVLTGELSNYAGFITQWSLISDNQRKCMEVAKSREHRTDDSGWSLAGLTSECRRRLTAGECF